ncbi:TPA: hypothetical protein ACS7Z7_001476 [Providencia alcalifaciens]
MDKSRQQFEEWFNDEYKTTMKDYDEPLVDFVRKQLFIVWQASRESLEIELPTKEPNPSQDNSAYCSKDCGDDDEQYKRKNG